MADNQDLEAGRVARELNTVHRARLATEVAQPFPRGALEAPHGTVGEDEQREFANWLQERDEL